MGFPAPLLWTNTKSNQSKSNQSETAALQIENISPQPLKSHALALSPATFTADSLLAPQSHRGVTRKTSCMSNEHVLRHLLSRVNSDIKRAKKRELQYLPLWKYCIISTLLVFLNVTEPQRGQWTAGKQPLCTSQALILCQGPLWPLRKSHRRSWLTFCRGWQGVKSVGVLIFLFLGYSYVCTIRQEKVEGHPERVEINSTHKSSRGPASCNCTFFPSPSCFPTFDASIFFSFNLINHPAQQRAVRCVRWGLSISLIKQELIKGLPVPMQAKGLSHIMHNLLDKKKASLHE